MKRYLWILALVTLVQGCATQGKMPLNASDEAEQREQMRAVHTDLVEEMIRQENYHAALAHIEELRRGEQKADRLLLLHAEVLFKLGRIQEAHADYVRLMGGPFDAEAMHGIGLMHAINDPGLSLDYLGKAARGKPTDAGMRNDYGYALLRHGDYGQGRLHLETAHELAPGDARYRNNALLAMLILNDEVSAGRLIKKSGVSPDVVQRIRHQARNWQARVDRQQEAPAGQAVTQARAEQAL